MTVTKNETMKTLDLNISENYVPHWGAWEVGRELITNAIDADPKKYESEFVDDDTLQIFTSTVPTISQLKIIGNGTKAGDDASIGQFGEGFKLAALVICRLGGTLNIVTPKYSANFKLEITDYMDDRVLVMQLEQKKNHVRGCTMTITLEGIKAATEGKFLDDRKAGMKEKVGDKVRFYYKGVFVEERDQSSLYDWNLTTVTLNRDRSLIDYWSLISHVAVLMDRHMTAKMAEQLVSAKEDCFELEVIRKWPEHFGHQAAKLIRQEVRKRYGDDVVVATDDSQANQIASSKGKKVIHVNEGIYKVASKSDDDKLQSATEFIETPESFEQVFVEGKYEQELAELNRLLDILEVNASLNIFQNAAAQMNTYGSAVFNQVGSIREIWLNEVLFLPGNRKQRLSTLVHEAAHIWSKASDGTLDFEAALDDLAGRLALYCLDHKAQETKVEMQ